MTQSRLVKFLRGVLRIREYESETTLFMRQFMVQHPEEAASQKKGRAIWWDKGARERTAPPEATTAPKSGGAEYTFKA